MSDETARDKAEAFFDDVFTGLLEGDLFTGKGYTFKPKPITWNADIAQDASLVRAHIRDYLIRETTDTLHYFPTQAAASASIDVFFNLWVNQIEDKSVKTLYAGLAGKIAVTVEFLVAVEALKSVHPLQDDYRGPVIYFKTTGDGGVGVLRKVAETSSRMVVSSWAEQALQPPLPEPAAVKFLEDLWNDNLPFAVRSADAPPYQVGRFGSTLANRRAIEEFNVLDTRKDPTERSRWLSCVTASEAPTVYYELFPLNRTNVRERHLEAVSIVRIGFRSPPAIR